MGYADLAAGDAWKAVLLIDLQLFALRNQPIAIPGSETSKQLEALIGQIRESYQELIESIQMLEDYHGLMEICRQGNEKYGKHLRSFFRVHESSAVANVGKHLDDSKVEFDTSQGPKTLYEQMFGVDKNIVHAQSGWVLFVPYAFMPAKYLMRQDDTVNEAQALFRSASSSCELSYSLVSGTSSTSPNVLGVFATRDISPSESLFEDATAIAASDVSASAPSKVPMSLTAAVMCENCYGQTSSSLPISADCCRTGYCSQQCLDMAISTYHRVLCGKNFDWLYQEAAKKPLPINLKGPTWLRVLATCVQSGQHPLELPAIARLVPCYSTGWRKWSFTISFTQPIRILQQLGINHFKDRRYETWVLQTIWARLANNQVAHPSGLKGISVRTLNPLYTFLNHSCEENAEWKAKSQKEHPYCVNGSTKVLHAKRPIKKGEEICVTYAPFSGQETKEERLAVIQSWVGPGGKCGCSKCGRET